MTLAYFCKKTCRILQGACDDLVGRRLPLTTRYAEAMARYHGQTPHAHAYWKGRVALYAILRGLGVCEGDEVILPGYTCVVVPNAIMFCKAKPKYIDIDPITYNLDPTGLDAAMSDRAKAIMAQHSYGIPADLDPIMAWGSRHGVPVFEDCCHVFGSRYKSRLCGTMGAASFFSGQWTKPFSTGFGGIAVFNDEEVGRRAREITEQEAYRPGKLESLILAAQLLVHHAFVYPASFTFCVETYRWLGRHKMAMPSGVKSELTGIGELPEDYFKTSSAVQAACGIFEVKRGASSEAHRRRVAAFYEEELQKAKWPMPELPDYADPVYLRYPVRVQNKQEMLRLASKHFIELGDWFDRPLHYAKSETLEPFGYEDGMCPKAEKAAREVVNLPLHPRVGLGHARRTMKLLLTHGKPVELPY
ncbi:MAG: DegT/DnrJ/EryC1/StrS family aminotransferase [Phycisphaerae bacterium]